METTKTTTPNLKLGEKVSWKSQAKGTVKLKKGTVAGIVAAGKAPNATKYPGLRAAGKRTCKSYVINVDGKFFFPHVSLLNKA